MDGEFHVQSLALVLSARQHRSGTGDARGQAGLAQLVEQLIRNEKVGGSTPLAGTNSQVLQSISGRPAPSRVPESCYDKVV